MLEEGEHLLHGPGRLDVEAGSVEVLGYRVEAGGSLVVPVGRSVLARVEAGARASYTGRSTPAPRGSYERWSRAVAELGDLGSRILLVGPSDVGKSTLAAWIANTIASRENVRPLFATIDIGQNENYCPGFTSSVVVEPPFIPGGGGRLYRACFVGSFTPATSVARYVYCSRRIVEGWSGPLVMDSDGWVTLWSGLESKVAVAAAVGFDKLVLVGLPDNRAEYVERKLEGVEVVRLPSLVDSKKTRGERRIHRERLLARALAGGRERGFRVDSTPVYGGPLFAGERVDPRVAGEVLGVRVYYAERVEGELRVVARRDPGGVEGARIVEPGWERGLLAALYSGESVAPGITTRVNYRTGTLYIYTPFDGSPDYIELGAARVDPDSFMGRAKW